MSASSRFFAGLLPVLLTALVLLIGLIKFEIGLSRDRPVGYLALLCVFTFIVLIMQTNVRLLTTRGEAVLQKLRDANSTLQTAAKGDTRTLSCSDVVLAFALWGPAMLSGAKFAKMRATLLSQQSSGTTFGIAGCGGSSCGGGGCGGGGGGGGCGGCGS